MTEQLTITRRLVVINPSEKAVNINQIKLGGLSTSDYTLIINGQQTNISSNVYLRGKDSLYILINAQLKKKDLTTPFLISDSILFYTGKGEQKIYLTAWGRDAVYYQGDTIKGNVTWDSTRVRFIYKTVFVAAGSTLTIEKGTEIKATKGNGLKVAGMLIVRGDSNAMVKFAGPRLDSYFNDIPGQWKGITILPGSKNNQIDWCEIKNAETGISAGNEEESADKTELKVTNTILKNHSRSGLMAYHTDLTMWNCLVTNFAATGLELNLGGKYLLFNNTIYNDSRVFSRKGPLISIDNIKEGISSSFNTEGEIKNNIIWGTETDEVISTGDKIKDLNIEFKRNIVKSSDTFFTSDTANYANIDPLFKDAGKSIFELKENSPSINKGLTIPFFNTDLYGRVRTEPYDLGAFEFYKP